MTPIVFRHLPAVAEVKRQLELQFRDRLLDDEIEELPHLIDDASRALFGITSQDTFYWALPDAVRAAYGRAEWEANFDILGIYTRDPNAHWRAFGLDLRCPEGRGLHCFEVFGRQLICALHRLHPQAVLAFVEAGAAQAARRRAVLQDPTRALSGGCLSRAPPLPTASVGDLTTKASPFVPANIRQHARRS